MRSSPGWILGLQLLAFASAGALRPASSEAHTSGRNFAAKVRQAMRTQGIALPGVRQGTTHTCGTASYESILQYYGISDHPEAFYAKRLGTSGNGTPPRRLVTSLRRSGLGAELVTGMTMAQLDHEISQGHPVIVAYQAWADPAKHVDYAKTYEEGHYSIITRTNKRYVYLMDPATGGARGRIGRAQFNLRWHDQTDAKTEPLEHLGIVVRTDKKPVNRVYYYRTVDVE